MSACKDCPGNDRCALRDDIDGLPECVVAAPVFAREHYEIVADRDRLAAELATSGPSCDRCQSSHCCSVAGHTPPLCVTDPDGSMPLWMPWTNEDVRKRLDVVYSQVDRLAAELANMRRLLSIALPHVEASAGAEHLFDGFRPQRRPLDVVVEEIRAALAKLDERGEG